MKLPQLVFGVIGLLVMAFQMFCANYFEHLGSGFCMFTGLVGAAVAGELVLIGLGRGR